MPLRPIRRLFLLAAIPCLLPAPLAAAAARKDEKPASIATVRAAAERGDAAAQLELANRLANGEGVAADQAAAAGWYRKAAEQGDAEAQHQLGLTLMFGLGVPADTAEAMHWLQRAAAGGVVDSYYWLADSYESGRGGIAVDAAEAARLYRRGAEKGHASSQSALARLYEKGLGVPRNDAEAVAWYERAAEQGNPVAQHGLGRMYAAGRGVTKDGGVAAGFYQDAADQGFNVAMLDLADALASGRGIGKDLACAWFWYDLAAREGIELAGSFRDALTPRLQPSELADARRMLEQTSTTSSGRIRRPSCAGETFSFDVENLELAELLRFFRERSGLPIEGLDGVSRKVSLEGDQLTWPSALTTTLRSIGYRWERKGDAIVVTPLPAKP